MSQEPESVSIQSSLRGNLLIAMPQLRDSHFHRSVTLMVAHDEKGAFGILLGEPTGTTVAEVASALGIRWMRSDVLARYVRIGGPCERERIWLMHGGDAPLPAAAPIGPGLFLGSSPTLLSQLNEHGDVPMMVFGGYAGWSSGQLEAELASNSWLPGDPAPDLIFGTPADEVWARALELMGLNPSQLLAGGDASA